MVILISNWILSGFRDEIKYWNEVCLIQYIDGWDIHVYSLTNQWPYIVGPYSVLDIYALDLKVEMFDIQKQFYNSWRKC